MTNPVIESLLNHRSVRKFLPRPVEPEIIDLILKAGTRAATGGNLQLYSFVVVDDPARKQQLDEEYPQMEFRYVDIPVIILALADLYRVRRWFEMNGVESQVICNNTLFNLFMANWDALIALQNIVVAAESLGLGTCYVGNALMMDIGHLLGAPGQVFPAGLITVGYPDGLPEVSSRLPMEAVVHHNSYHTPGDDDIESFYAERNRHWEKLPEDLKARLNAKGISNIPQGVAKRKFAFEDYFISQEKGCISSAVKRNKNLLENLNKAGFLVGD